MKTQSLANVMLWLLVAFMFLLAVGGFATPVSAAAGFGVPLADSADGFYLHVKADRDLAIGVALAALIVLHERRALIAVIAACMIGPLIDGVLVAANGHRSVLYALGVHGSAFVYCAVLLGLLVRENAKGVRRETSPGPRTDHAEVTP